MELPGVIASCADNIAIVVVRDKAALLLAMINYSVTSRLVKGLDWLNRLSQSRFPCSPAEMAAACHPEPGAGEELEKIDSYLAGDTM